MLDARIREVLQSDGDFVLVTNPESSPQGQMISKVESGAERFVAASIDRRQYIGSYSDLGEPRRAVRWLCPSQNRCDADLADPGGTGGSILQRRSPAPQRHLEVEAQASCA